MKKKMTRLLVALLIAINVMGATAFAADVTASNPMVENSVVVTRAEEVTWIYYQKDGIIYKRLWSQTEAKWISDPVFVRYA